MSAIELDDVTGASASILSWTAFVSMSGIASAENARPHPNVDAMAMKRVNHPTGLVVSSDGARWRCMTLQSCDVGLGAQNLVDEEVT